MAIIARSYPWTQQPRYLGTINTRFSTPASLIVPVGSSPVDIARRIVLPGNGSTGNGAIGPAAFTGGELAMPTGTGLLGFWLPTTARLFIDAGSDWTFLFVVPKAALTGGNPGLLRASSTPGLAAGDAGGGTLLAFTLSPGSTPWMRVNGSGVALSGSRSVAVGDRVVVAFRCVSASSADIFINGQKCYSGTHSIPTVSEEISNIGWQYTPDETAGPQSLFGYFKKALPDSQLVELTLNPWVLFN